MTDTGSPNWQSKFMWPLLAMGAMGAVGMAWSNGKLLTQLTVAKDSAKDERDENKAAIAQLAVKTGNRFTGEDGSKLLEKITDIELVLAREHLGSYGE